jgi:hypothetical protein
MLLPSDISSVLTYSLGEVYCFVDRGASGSHLVARKGKAKCCQGPRNRRTRFRRLRPQVVA